MKKKPLPIVEVVIEKLVHGGQGLGTLPDGRKVFVWNALPSEKLQVQLTKQRRDYAEGVTNMIIMPSADRVMTTVAPEILSTQPWAIMTFDSELTAKQAIVKELFVREKVALPEFAMKTKGQLGGYRNKMEYGFWGDDDGISFAHFQRGSHGKIKVTDSLLANDRLNDAGHTVLDILNRNHIRASQLKSIIIRAVMPDQAAVALFVRDENFPELAFPEGTVVYYSDPRSPASVPTEELYRHGATTLKQRIGKTELTYDVLSFFQVNVPIFGEALTDIKRCILPETTVVDMYSGVGTIGLALEARPLKLIELDPFNIAMARTNAGEGVEVVQASTEQALEYITAESCIIVDPPRSGLHKKVIERIIEVQPKQVLYLSCNPVTQARDVAMLQSAYDIADFAAYDFFPRTPHIETFVNLVRK